MTAYATAAIALFAVVEGFRIASFAIAAGTVGPANAVTRLAAWDETMGVMAAARRPGPLRLDAKDPGQLERRERRLEDYLAVRPMASSVWLELAELRYTMAQPKKKVIDALSLSQLTGPLEGVLMFRRATLALLIWGDLPSDMRDRSARDVALAENTPSEAIYLRTLIAGRPAADQNDLRWRLLQIEGLPEHRLESLGMH
ncbi:MAG TPA: hypothetical protein VGV41_16215 [Pseudolabrys sp.]|uniref:hypothetical protein n=1 Tax=Pseudolabrys sp. TaxID=1960880 RepID=UPI002DDD4E9B|nr:hypothetical protein [Pseudolabrys sp.]HEV2630179.1 hypothetical protein [Pseudolabrys sp.]